MGAYIRKKIVRLELGGLLCGYTLQKIDIEQLNGQAIARGGMVGNDWKTLLLTQPELILGEHVAGVGSFMMLTALSLLQDFFGSVDSGLTR